MLKKHFIQTYSTILKLFFSRKKNVLELLLKSETEEDGWGLRDFNILDCTIATYRYSIYTAFHLVDRNNPPFLFSFTIYQYRITSPNYDFVVNSQLRLVNNRISREIGATSIVEVHHHHLNQDPLFLSSSKLFNHTYLLVPMCPQENQPFPATQLHTYSINIPFKQHHPFEVGQDTSYRKRERLWKRLVASQ